MKFTIKKQILETLISNLNPYLEKRDLSSVQSHILFEANENSLKLKASDFEIGLCYDINDVDIKEAGLATANGKNILDIIRNLKDGEITISTSEDIMSIKQNRSLFKINMQNANDYSAFPTIDGKSKFDINASVLAGALKKVESSIDGANPKQELSGALLDMKNDSINVVGTDGKHVRVNSINIINEKEFKIILPKRAITEIQKIFNKEIEVFYDENILIAKSNNFLFFTKLINGKYANYEAVVNQQFNNNIEIKCDQIAEGIRTVKMLSETIVIKFSRNLMSFEALSETGSQGWDEIETELNVDSPFDIRIRAKHILEFLANINTATFTMSYNEAGMPFRLTSEDLSTIITQIK